MEPELLLQKFEMVYTPIDELIPASYNPRKIDADEFEKLVSSIRLVGFIEPVIVNKDKTIIGGHQRIKAARQLGLTQVPVIFLDLNKDAEKTLNIRLNRIGGKFDEDLLAALVQTIAEEERGNTGLDQNEMENRSGGNHRPQTFRDCVQCGQRFGPLHHLKTKLCSGSCRLEYMKGRPTAKKGKKYPHLQRAESRPCVVCSKVFRGVFDFVGRKQKYCSKACWNIRADLHKRPCENCGAVVRMQPHMRSRFCSQKCSAESAKEDRSPQWKGEAVSYSGLHKWVALRLGRPKRCEFCGRDGLTRHEINWANKSGEYKRELDDWLRLCVPCHVEYDKRN